MFKNIFISFLQEMVSSLALAVSVTVARFHSLYFFNPLAFLRFLQSTLQYMLFYSCFQNGSNRPAVDEGTASGASSGDSVFTPGTERRLERLPAMLGAPVHDVYLGGSFPVSLYLLYFTQVGTYRKTLIIYLQLLFCYEA